MYKCTECGLEFETKPDYCDCGNDEFVLTVKEEEKPEEKTIVDEVKPEPEKKAVSAEEFFSKQTEQKNYYNSYSSQENRYKLPVSPFALIIFVICLLLSIMILFLWNPVKETTEKITQVIERTENIAVPSIDKLWKNSIPVKTETKTVNQENTVKSEPKVTVVPSNKTTSTPKSVAKPVSKPGSKPLSSAKTQSKPVTKPAANNKTAQTVKPAQPVQTQADEQAKKAQEEAKKAQEAKAKAEAEALAAAEQAKKAAQAKQELHSYKINLRNAIGQKIDFTRVIGDGDCVVTFKVDSSGRLVNRTFAKQSTNITLNNAVYNAVMSVPSFTPPPSGYKNETMSLNVSFKNGNFAITLE